MCVLLSLNRGNEETINDIYTPQTHNYEKDDVGSGCNPYNRQRNPFLKL